jgi:hypothetical protein
MSPECTPLQLLRELARQQGVRPSDDDLRAVLDFLGAIQSELASLEDLLAPGSDE